NDSAYVGSIDPPFPFWRVLLVPFSEEKAKTISCSLASSIEIICFADPTDSKRSDFEKTPLLYLALSQTNSAVVTLFWIECVFGTLIHIEFPRCSGNHIDS